MTPVKKTTPKKVIKKIPKKVVKKKKSRKILYFVFFAFLLQISGFVGGYFFKQTHASILSDEVTTTQTTPIPLPTPTEIPIPPHIYNSFMFANSMDKMKELQTTNFWAHTDENGKTFSERAEGQPAQWYGENLYKGPCTIREAMKLFENSPTHKANLDHKYDYATITIAPKTIPEEGDVGDNCYMVFQFMESKK